tara:strand:+ start:214 stop:483 length:270 start_codon:yes stop_codon:yes gene_type:complete
MKNIFLTVLLAFPFLYSDIVLTHSGRTNQEGCHVNRSTGQYHCHQTKQRSFGGSWCLISNGSLKGCGYSSQSSCENAARYSPNAYCTLR